MANPLIAIDVQWDDAGMRAVDQLLESEQGEKLTHRVDLAMGKELRPLVKPLRAAEQGSGLKNPTKAHYKSIKVVKSRKRKGEAAAWTAGPRDHVAHLLVQGHDIVTHAGRDTGKRSRAFPYPGPVYEREGAIIAERLASDLWAEEQKISVGAFHL